MAGLVVTTQADGVPLLRTSERNDFKRCPWLWDKVWNRGYTTRREPTWAWFGSAIHRGLEEWYQPGFKRGGKLNMLGAFDEALDDQVRRVYTEGKEIDEQDIVDGKELGHAMLLGYVKYWGKDSEWEVIQREQPFQIDVADPSDPSRVLVTYAGTWDLLARHKRTGEWWLWDHKTRKAFPSQWEFFTINDQAGSYLWVAPEILRHLGIFGKKDVITGLIFNELKKQMPDTRPLNAEGLATNKPQRAHYIARFEEKGIKYNPKGTIAEFEALAQEMRMRVVGDVSATQPGPRFHREEIWRSPEERVSQARRVQGEASVMAGMRAGTIPVWKTPTEDCVRCPVFEMCQLDENSTREGEMFADAVFLKRDPYRDHRVDFAERGVSLATKAPKKKKESNAR